MRIDPPKDSLGETRKAHTPKANKEWLKELVKQDKVIDEVSATLGNLIEEQFEIPLNILEAIQANEEAWKNFQSFSQPYIRIRVAFIDAARNRPQEFAKRLRYFIAMTAKDKQFGFGGTENIIKVRPHFRASY